MFLLYKEYEYSQNNDYYNNEDTHQSNIKTCSERKKTVKVCQ